MGSQLLLEPSRPYIMQSLVILSVLGCAFAAPFLQYTPEVAAARARFTQLYNAQAAAAAAAPDDPNHAATVVHFVQPTHHFVQPTQHFVQPAIPHHGSTVITKWAGPVAATVPAGINGQITPVGDTADVAAARRSFEAAYNAALVATGVTARVAPQPTFHAVTHPQHVAQPQLRWTGPVAATVPAGVPGSVSQVAETADVAAANAAFQRAYSQAVAATTGRRF